MNADARIEAELCRAREDFRFWARQDGRLTRDEWAQKTAAERHVAELERALVAARKDES